MRERVMAMMRLAGRRDRTVSVIRMATTVVVMMMVMMMVWLGRAAKEVILRSTSYGCHLLATVIWTIVSCMPAVFVVQAPNTVFVSANQM